MRTQGRLVAINTDQKQVKRRLVADGWANEGGAKHDAYVHPAKGIVIVPRHKTLSAGVARAVAKAAGWTD